MVNIHPSSLIGAQAYAAQLRRQYGEEETARAFSLGDRPAARSGRQARRPADLANDVGDSPQRPAAPRPDAVHTGAGAATGARTANPTIGELLAQPNPPARPLYSSAKREAPNPNAQLRNTRPGTHQDITI
ncbi:MAG: hypothetical protein EXR08_10935 [Alphaproteobacteria bacterium]|nr:hypothetical protein [Alphaproteobacteria bacterium]